MKPPTDQCPVCKLVIYPQYIDYARREYVCFRCVEIKLLTPRTQEEVEKLRNAQPLAEAA